ncbi:hypothetical protein ACTPC6_03900 [Clostridioides difficile]
MKLLIPIQNLVFEEVAVMGDIIFLPNACIDICEAKLEHLLLDNTIMEDMDKIIKLCSKISDLYINCTLAVVNIFNEDIGEKEYNLLLNRACNKVDRALDYIRYKECRIDREEWLPSLSGIIKGRKEGILLDFCNDKYQLIHGDEYYFYFQPGIGLMSNIIKPEEDDSDLYEVLFSNRNDEVYLNCRSAFTRLNEAMYITNKSASFVYLISTLEFLCVRPNVKFQDIKRDILAFAAKDSARYKYLSNELYNIYKNIRTDVVHFGKNIFEYEEKTKYYKMINLINGIIQEYCINVIKSGIKDFRNLDIEINERLKNLDI